ncbi:MAG: TMEM165/GDT1 family protein [Colwelliaceae bacterium]|jgi:putative Ca2+/H+ antiporter (TMEM165/GDT1 family)|nr:TMEM165/GDT1 family protein [Colwelliaceae bacterium]
MSEISLVSSTIISFVAVFFAEFGDKSQLICIALATTYAARAVLIGATSAFVLLNIFAVIIGSTFAAHIPNTLVATVAITLFSYFGISALLYKEGEENNDVVLSNESIIIGVFSLVFFAELGDKTQFTIMSLSATKDAIGVWLGSTLAVICTSALGIYAGTLLFEKVKKTTLHRVTGLIFLTLAAITLYRYFY